MGYGFIGCGNMGSAIVKALRQSTKDIMVSDRSGRAKPLVEKLRLGYFDNETIATFCSTIFLAVKPQMMQGMLLPLQPVLKERKPLLITMAAGLTIHQIEDFAGCTLPVIRIMPNTPTAVGKGVIEYCCNDLVTEDMLTCFLRDMAPCGTLDPLEESLFDAASALSGCGPAYAYLFMEALADGAVACGVPRAKAMEYAAATLSGAAEMVLQTHQHPGELKDAVCSPGGSTIAGVHALEAKGFRGAVMDCVIAAYEKNKLLGK